VATRRESLFCFNKLSDVANMSEPAPSYLFVGYKFRVLDAVDPIGSNLFSALSVAVFCYVPRTVDRYQCSPQLTVP